ncbi:MAG: response regulator [bacterium]|nr:response regulator [bacterium]
MNKKVLIVDDDPFILDMYVLKFKESGFQVDTAQDGKSGLKKAKDTQPDVVLLDVVMPAMDGFDVLQELKKIMPAPLPKIILLTNLGQKEDVDRGLQLGADDYIIKAHFTPTEVVNKVKKVLGLE